jgi:hypothetical protein
MDERDELILKRIDDFKGDFDNFKDNLNEKFDKFNQRLSMGSNKFTEQKGLIDNNGVSINELKEDCKEIKQENSDQKLDIDRLKNNMLILKWIAGGVSAGFIGLIFEFISRKI